MNLLEFVETMIERDSKALQPFQRKVPSLLQDGQRKPVIIPTSDKDDRRNYLRWKASIGKLKAV